MKAAAAMAPRTTLAARATNAEAAALLFAGGVLVVVPEGFVVPVAEGVWVVEGLVLLRLTGLFGPSGPSGSVDPPDGGPGTTVLVPTEACLYFASVLSELFFGGLMTPLMPL